MAQQKSNLSALLQEEAARPAPEDVKKRIWEGLAPQIPDIAGQNAREEARGRRAGIAVLPAEGKSTRRWGSSSPAVRAASVVIVAALLGGGLWLSRTLNPAVPAGPGDDVTIIDADVPLAGVPAEIPINTDQTGYIEVRNNLVTSPVGEELPLQALLDAAGVTIRSPALVTNVVGYEDIDFGVQAKYQVSIYVYDGEALVSSAAIMVDIVA